MPVWAAEPLTLERALADVAAQDPWLAGRRAETRAAFARARRAGAGDAPMLDLMAENVPVGGGFGMDGMTMRVVGLEQRVVVSGARGIARQAALAEARANGAAADDAHWQRLADAWIAYADAYWSSQRAEAARGHRATMDRMSSSAKARYESGRGRLEDLLRVEAERARITADAVAFEAEERTARATLAELRGVGGDGLDVDLVAPGGALAPDSDAAWSTVVAAHPRVRVASERERARRESARSMRRMVWPDLTLRASYGFRSTLDDGTMQDNMWSAGVGIMLPIGTGSRQGAEAAEMDAMADAARSDRSAEALALERELRSLRVQASAAARTASLLADTVEVADRRVLAAAWSAYEAGRTDLAGVFDAAHALYAEEVDVTRAWQTHARTLARLLAVSARGELVGLQPGAWAPVTTKGDAR
ncbi:MAG: TolC family protein [Candidatus Eisenbacteria bacterium]|nr:TolC family protein [Candidatus Eisenbacteria bacterium]